MAEYLPKVYERFTADYPDVMAAYTALAERLHGAGPLSARERRLAKLGVAIGRESEGAVPRPQGRGRGHRAGGHPARGGARDLDRRLPGGDGCLRLDQRGSRPGGIGSRSRLVLGGVGLAPRRLRGHGVPHRARGTRPNAHLAPGGGGRGVPYGHG